MNNNKKYSFSEAVKFFMLTIICVVLALQAVSISFLKTDISQISAKIGELENYLETYISDSEYYGQVQKNGYKILTNVEFGLVQKQNKDYDMTVTVIPDTVTEETVVFVRLPKDGVFAETGGETFETQKTKMNRFIVTFDTKTDDFNGINNEKIEVIVKNGDTVKTEMCVIS